jgi:hypothetical protein
MRFQNQMDVILPLNYKIYKIMSISAYLIRIWKLPVIRGVALR